jgi:hypothetical protein
VTTNRTRKAISGNAGKATKTDAAKKPAAKKAGERSSPPRKRANAPKAAADPKATVTRVAAEAARQLLELTGKESEGVTALERTEEGWRIQLEVVEVRRIPDTTDMLALYDLEVDEHGELEGYRRVRRYTRAASGGE